MKDETIQADVSYPVFVQAQTENLLFGGCEENWDEGKFKDL